MDNFTQYFNECCLERDLNPKQLSRLVHISDSSLYAYSNGASLPTLNNLVKLANFFNCSVNFLVGIDDNPRLYKFKTTYDKSVFCPRYLKLLKEYKTTHYKIKDKIGVTMSNLTKWKNGTIPYLNTLVEIAKLFGVSVDYLIGRSDVK